MQPFGSLHRQSPATTNEAAPPVWPTNGRGNVASDPSLALPRILCLHGGGTNASIFRMQLRAVEPQLGARFRLVFVDAPFPSAAGPDVLAVYGSYGPFQRWHTWQAVGVGGQPPEPPSADEVRSSMAAIEKALEAAMLEDSNSAGASGDWVGVLGFSQGAKVAASLLLRQQGRGQWSDDDKPWMAGVKFRFGVLMNGRGPLIGLEESRWEHSARGAGVGGPKLHIPTIHVHGLQDPGLQAHRALHDEWCEEGSTTVVEWDGGHRLPIRSKDVEMVVDAIMALADDLGIDLPAIL